MSSKPTVNLKLVALPAEHGGWGFLMVPVLAGLIFAFSVPGLVLSFAALFLFLTHQPLKVALKDSLKGKIYPRTRAAILFAMSYSLLTAVLFLLALRLSPSSDFVKPLMVALPLFAVVLAFDLRSSSREWLPEIMASASFGSVAAAIAILGGANLWLASGIWFLIALHSASAILYVRARLRLERALSASALPQTCVFVLAFFTCAWMSKNGAINMLPGLAFAALFVRSMYGLSKFRKVVPAKSVGFQEIGYGLLVSLAIGFCQMGIGR